MKKYKNDWWEKYSNFENQKIDEEAEVLKDHDEKWRKKREELEKECEEDGGHNFVDLPDNGVNHPHFLTGEWPKSCSKCHKQK
jgi:hypothetical protein